MIDAPALASFRGNLGWAAIAWAFLGCGGATATVPCEGAECPEVPEGECRVGGVSYASGTAGIPDADGCNTCRCQDGQLACTLIDCFDEASCEFGGETFPSGATFSSQSCDAC